MPCPPKKIVQWWVEKMTLLFGGEHVVLSLVAVLELRFIKYMMTTLAVTKYWDGLGREPVCQCELGGSRAHLPACMRAVT